MSYGAEYRCGRCNATVTKSTRVCPHCRVRLAGIRCNGCKFVGDEEAFSGDRCPKCGSTSLSNFGGAGDGSGSGSCFVCTAAFEDPFAPEVEALRRWRDRVLAPRPLGRLLIRFYYAIGPHLAGPVAAVPPLRRLVRSVVGRVARHLS